MVTKKIPVGIESFEEIRKDGFYYVDKTDLIKELLEDWGKVNLFTRPRRFGKSLNMSMLKSFFEIGSDTSLFDGLNISKEIELCKKFMGQFPVIFISLKGVTAGNFSDAKEFIQKIIHEEARRFQFLLESDKLTTIDKQLFSDILGKKTDDNTIVFSLREMTELLRKHYEKKVIVLIDEYDVPLAKANEQGYYDEMVLLLRNLFENVLKTNDNLYFAVLTGCLRVAKESIFTGLNNFNTFSITDVDFDEYFGFTDEEVKKLLAYYGQENHLDIVKEWYDGYRFGNVDIYCPWDVLCYCKAHRKNEKLAPQNYWIHTSENVIVEHFIYGMGKAKEVTKNEMERLIHGEAVQKKIHQELTYKELYSSTENIWSALFMTGYLTSQEYIDENEYKLVIPNREIRNIFTEKILSLFKAQVAEDGKMLDKFCEALYTGNALLVQKLFTEYLNKTISIRDTFVKKPIKENFYHGILLGILAYKAGWTVSSNKETGDGFSDIMIQIDNSDTGIIIEIKYAEHNLEEECKKALDQISKKRYEDRLHQEGINRILKYAIACNRKECCVAI